jgi:GNAT superfamily N-acetyltransferase
MVIVRPLSTSDSIHELTALLHRAYARLGGMGLNYTAVDQTVEVTRQRIQGGCCFVAMLDDVIVGTIVVHPTYATNDCEYFTRPGVAAALQFAVEPSSQGLGIGRLLLRSAEEWAITHGFRELAMDTAEPAEHLVRLYKGLGYAHAGWVQWPGKVYRSVVLSKPLAANT